MTNLSNVWKWHKMVFCLSFYDWQAAVVQGFRSLFHWGIQHAMVLFRLYSERHTYNHSIVPVTHPCSSAFMYLWSLYFQIWNLQYLHYECSFLVKAPVVESKKKLGNLKRATADLFEVLQIHRGYHFRVL